MQSSVLVNGDLRVFLAYLLQSNVEQVLSTNEPVWQGLRAPVFCPGGQDGLVSLPGDRGQEVLVWSLPSDGPGAGGSEVRCG